MQVKGLEMAMHEPRGKVGVALGYATNEAGADHLVGFHDGVFVNPESVSFKGAHEDRDHRAGRRRSTSARRRSATGTPAERWNSAEKVLGLCFFGPAPRSFIQVDDVVGAVRAATGWDVTVDELLEIGERAVNLARLFNVREGFSRGRRPAARSPPRAARGRTAHGDVDRPGGVRGGDHPALRAEGLGSGDRRADAGAAAGARPRLGRGAGGAG